MRIAPESTSPYSARSAGEAMIRQATAAPPMVDASTGRLRFVTATSRFDGHDVSINIMRRVLQAGGAEVIHLGHNRSVEELVTAALQEDVHGVALSCYQGGHMETFRYLIDLLAARGGSHIKVFGGGGGVIVPAEIAELHAYGVSRIFSPEDGAKLGLDGMAAVMIRACDSGLPAFAPGTFSEFVHDGVAEQHRSLAQLITALESGRVSPRLRADLAKAAEPLKVPTLGVTGTGGAGKSSLIDELVRRIRLDQGDALNIAIVSVDPSRLKTGGALLGDRIRMNAIGPWGENARVFMRSMATRGADSEIACAVPDVVAACKVAGFDLVIVETSGIGQGDAAIVLHSDVSLYVMTPEFGAASQLEKIEMLDLADFVAVNKIDRRGALDALRDVVEQYRRNRGLWSAPREGIPVYGTHASRFNDDGVTALYQGLLHSLVKLGLPAEPGKLARIDTMCSSANGVVVPVGRSHYLAEVADSVRAYRKHVGNQVRLARERQQLLAAARMLEEANPSSREGGEGSWEIGRLVALAKERDDQLGRDARELLSRVAGRPERCMPVTNVWPAPRCQAFAYARSYCRLSKMMAKFCPGSCWRTCRAHSHSPLGCSRSGARAKTPRACSPARVTHFAPIADSGSSLKGWTPSASPLPSTPSPSTAPIPRCPLTSTARSAMPAYRSPR